MTPGEYLVTSDPIEVNAGKPTRQTVLTCYQRADAVSMQQALAARRRLEA